MSKTTALIWKEWQETSPFLWTALAIFIGLPLVGALEHSSRFRREFNASPVVILLGGILPIFVAVAGTSRDLGKPVEDFWRSRPVSAVRWMLAKFLVGLVIVLIACMLPLAVEYFLDPILNRDVLSTMAWLPLLWAVIYSVSFMIGCLIQRPAHSTILACAALLAIYFLPTVLPPLRWLLMVPWNSPYQNVDKYYAWRLCGLALVFFVLALLAVQRRWRVEPGPKFMYGSIAAVLLIFLASAGYHLGSNLPILQQIKLPPHEYVEGIDIRGDSTYLEIWREPTSPHTAVAPIARELQFTPEGLKISAQAWIPFWGGFNRYMDSTISPQMENIRYTLYCGNFDSIDLNVFEFRHYAMARQITTVPIPWPHPTRGVLTIPSPELYAWGDRLYLIGHNLATVDISNPRSPRLLSVTPLRYAERDQDGWDDIEATFFYGDAGSIIWNLPAVPGLPAMQRLHAAIGAAHRGFSFAVDGKILCEVSTGIREWKLDKLTDTQATFTEVGKTSPNLLDNFLGYRWGSDPHLENGLLYVVQGDRYNFDREFNLRLGIYAMDGPGAPRLMGHFAAASAGTLFVDPLPNGHAIVGGGNKLWLIGPPPHRD